MRSSVCLYVCACVCVGVRAAMNSKSSQNTFLFLFSTATDSRRGIHPNHVDRFSEFQEIFTLSFVVTTFADSPAHLLSAVDLSCKGNSGGWWCGGRVDRGGRVLGSSSIPVER